MQSGITFERCDSAFHVQSRGQRGIIAIVLLLASSSPVYALDLSQQARLARARALRFSEQTFYHADPVGVDIKRFDPAYSRTSNTFGPMAGYFVGVSTLANHYADLSRRRRPPPRAAREILAQRGGEPWPAIYPVLLRLTRVLTIDAYYASSELAPSLWQQLRPQLEDDEIAQRRVSGGHIYTGLYAELGGPDRVLKVDPTLHGRVHRLLIEAGFNSISQRNTVDGLSPSARVIGVFLGRDVRSIFAAFNLEHSESDDILD